MPKVSVIVPVFNVKDYLKKCIDSIINQTLRDIEIILVDDGSTDGSSKICDFYAAHDDRIRVIHKANEGLSCARNDGVKASKAHYIMFVDSDDWVESKFCELPYTIAEDRQADLVLFNYYSRNNYDEKTIIKMPFETGVMSEYDAIRFNVCVTNAAWIGLYSKNLFKNIKYPENKYYEDKGTSHKIIHAAKNVFFLNTALYNHRIDRKGSITTSLGTKYHPDLREMTILRINDLCNWGYDEFAQVDAFYLLLLYGCKSPDQICFMDMVGKMKMQTLVDFKFRRKILLVLFKISPTLFDVACIARGIRAK